MGAYMGGGATQKPLRSLAVAFALVAVIWQGKWHWVLLALLPRAPCSVACLPIPSLERCSKRPKMLRAGCGPALLGLS